MRKNEVQSISIIGCTAYTDPDNIKKCYDAGMDDVIHKPLTKAKILDILKKFNQIT